MVPPPDLQAQPEPEPHHDRLSILSVEIILEILNNLIQHRQSLAKLARVSKRFHSIVMPVLHKRLVVDLSSDEGHPVALAALEPFLTDAQRKRWMKQHRPSGYLNDNAVPPCAGYIRQVYVYRSQHQGIIKPSIAQRYLEEIFHNAQNIEIVDSSGMTELMAHGLASQKNLKALRLRSSDWGSKNMIDQLATIGGLQHLSIQLPDWYWPQQCKFVLDLLLNSTCTLKSFELRIERYIRDFLSNWGEKVRKRNPEVEKQAYDLAALESLSLIGIQFG
ncbi:hypothetical protein F66182_11196, partial [Fusarium sp. NRRL 66182]